MALTRNDACKHFMDGSTFVKCLMYYTATHAGKTGTFEIAALSSNFPGNSNPTDEQVQAFTDPLASTKYDTWCAALDAAPTCTTHTGHSGTLSA